MSNYNSNLQSNNIDLQDILNTINELPEVSGGEQVTPVISVNNSNGLITATAGAKSSTYQLAFQPAKTITPSATSQTVVSSGYYTGGDITVKGDSNLVSSNIKSGVSIFGINGTYVGSGGSSDTGMENALLDGTLTTYTNESITTIRAGAFAGYTRLKSVNFPNCITIQGTSNPGANTNIGAFHNCFSLTSISFPVCTSIGPYAFYRCSKLTSVNFPACSHIGSSVFYDCSSLTSISFPVCTNIGGGAFSSCSKLTAVNFPVCSYIGGGAFSSCSKLTAVNFPVCSYIDNYAFYGCTNLTTANFPACRHIGYRAFENCRALSQVYLMNSSVCTLNNSNAFSSTPFAGYSTYFSGTPYIYVPSSLVDAYKSATNWTYFSSYIVAFVSGGGHAGGSPD